MIYFHHFIIVIQDSTHAGAAAQTSEYSQKYQRELFKRTITDL